MKSLPGVADFLFGQSAIAGASSSLKQIHTPREMASVAGSEIESESYVRRQRPIVLQPATFPGEKPPPMSTGGGFSVLPWQPLGLPQIVALMASGLQFRRRVPSGRTKRK
jgi:hypothetical protein